MHGAAASVLPTHSRGIILATSALVILTNKHILNSHLVQIILEQEGGYKQVVIIREGSNKRHGSKFIIQLVQSEPNGPQIANAVYSVVHTVNSHSCHTSPGGLG